MDYVDSVEFNSEKLDSFTNCVSDTYELFVLAKANGQFILQV